MSVKKAGELINKYLLGVLTDDERNQLEEWLNASGSNKDFFNKICSSNRISSQYHLYQSIDEKKAHQEFLERTHQTGKKLYLLPLLKYAATAVVAIIVGVTLWLKNDQSNENFAQILPGANKAILVTNSGEQITLGSDSINQLEIETGVWVENEEGALSYSKNSTTDQTHFNTLITPRGGEYKITLADGTKVHLNADSELRYPTSFTQKSRDVYLKGEAFFEIAPDTECPFFVHVNDIQVKQYGTGFNVKSRQSNLVEVVLVHGEVSILTPEQNKEYMMKPSQLATYNKDISSVNLHMVNVDPYIGWTRGRFIFENKDLKEIMESLSLWYDVDIEFVNSDLENIEFTGNVSRESTVESIFRSIEFATNVHIKLSKGKVLISN